MSFDKEKDKPTIHILSVANSWSIIALADKYNLFTINVHIMKDIFLMFHCFFCAMSARMHIQKDMYSTKNNLSTASTIIIVSLTLTHCHTFSHTQSHNYWNIFGIFCNVKYILQTAKPTKINVHVLASRACGYYTYFYMLQQWPNVNKVTLLGPLPTRELILFQALKTWGVHEPKFKWF